MSGIRKRLSKAQDKVEFLIAEDPISISVRTGPFRVKKVSFQNRKFLRATGGDRRHGCEIYGYIFKSIPEDEPTGIEAIKKVEQLLRSRYPKYKDALKRVFEQNSLQGDPSDVGTWYLPFESAKFIEDSELPYDIIDFVKIVLRTSRATRSGHEFRKWRTSTENELSKRHEGYDAFKLTFFESKKIQGDFNDMLSWEGLHYDDNLTDMIAPTEMRGFLKAVGRKAYFFISNRGIVCRLRGEVVSTERLKECAMKMWAIEALISYGPKGLLIHDDRRLLLYVYLLLAIAAVVIVTIITDWLESPFEVLASLLILLISVPALWSFVSNEQDPVWTALRGQRYLYDDEDVMKTFDIDELDAAIFGLVDGGCRFLSNERMCHNPDEGSDLIKPGPNALTNTKQLRKVGIFVGHHLARRCWEKTNYTVVRNNQELHITFEPSLASWSTGLRSELPVG